MYTTPGVAVTLLPQLQPRAAACRATSMHASEIGLVYAHQGVHAASQRRETRIALAALSCCLQTAMFICEIRSP